MGPRLSTATLPGRVAVVHPGLAAAAVAFGRSPHQLRDIGGETGATAGLGDDLVVRVMSAATADLELASMAGASVPVPEVLDRADLPSCSALLLRRMPGRTADAALRKDPSRAGAIGTACGSVVAQLSACPAPRGVPVAPGLDPLLDQGALLHLDVHPHNVLLDDAGAVTAVLDWANAATGTTGMDAARSAAILRFDPGAVPWHDDKAFRTMQRNFEVAAHLDAVTDEELAWAYRYQLRDLAARHPESALSGLRTALSELELAPVDRQAPVSRRRPGGPSRARRPAR